MEHYFYFTTHDNKDEGESISVTVAIYNLLKNMHENA